MTRNADGTAHVIVRWGQPWVDDPAHSAVVDAHPGDLISDELISSQNQVFQASPPINADELMSYLKNAHPIAEQGAPELLSSVRDLHREWPLDGDQKAAVVAVLRRHGHLDYAGQAVDRLGRKGYAFSLDHQHGGLPTRTTLIFDAGSGSLLAVEDMLTGSAGKLNVTTPAVVSYTCFG
ncbi:hypothetical protein [Austwickia sp. TVS 96-490-7B]|uniref:hypothetical protein n=1 Tax=Austwickia sp. TVS 96-490-7B TaxID=2830843 RepID=UPI001C59147B|nr:hypothetical protein [Austwickia sp. TVS 96-490-7B]